MRIGFVGAGRVARTLSRALTAASYEVVAVASRSPASAELLAGALPGCRVYDTAQEVVEAADLVFLTVPDDSIAAVAAELRWRPGMAAVHCSGATDLDVLAPAAEAGAAIGGFHPMHSFADVEVALETLPGTTFALAGDPALVAQLEEIAHALGGRPIQLPPGSRTRILYHASAPFAAPFVITLLDQASHIWEAFGLTQEDALAAFIPFLRGVVDGVERAGLAGSLSGPVTRGDIGTIRKHLAALSELGPEVVGLYREMTLRSLPLALERGTLSEERAEELRALLTGADT